jgi:hypothetical protein
MVASEGSIAPAEALRCASGRRVLGPGQYSYATVESPFFSTSENGLAEVFLLPDRLNLFGFQWPDRRKAGIVETPHRLFIDGPNIVQRLNGFMDGRPAHLAPLELRSSH